MTGELLRDRHAGACYIAGECVCPQPEPEDDAAARVREEFARPYLDKIAREVCMCLARNVYCPLHPKGRR
jgi:hypothetical protein